MHYSPLRYPGGKTKLYRFVSYIITDLLKLEEGTYIEPFAGGAGVALSLLFENKVSQIVINDYDKAICSFWRALITDTEEFLRLFDNTPVNIEQWKIQKGIYNTQNKKYSLELGFATFYLNRTNHSGILMAGPIGGFDQSGKYKIDARYSKKVLKRRLELVAKYKNKLKIYNADILSFIKNYLPYYTKDSFIYFDPPYYDKGEELYTNFFVHEDHLNISKYVDEIQDIPWMMTYDNAPEIISLYHNKTMKEYDLRYSVATNRKASEIMIMSEKHLFPVSSQLANSNIDINLR